MNHEWWYPQLTDRTFVAALRRDYHHDAALSDEVLIKKYAEGRKYAVTWDHLGDAYDQFEQLSDAYLTALDQLKNGTQP